MNHLLAANKENAEKHGLLVCIFCNKAFSNHQTLGSHLKFHEEAMRPWNNWNHLDNSSTSIGINAPNLSSIAHNQTDNPSGGSGKNMSTVFDGTASSSPLSNRFCSNQSGQLNATSFPENNLRNLNSQFIVSPNLSSGNVELHCPPCFPSTAFSPFSSNAATGFPLDPSYFGSNGVFQYNVGELQSSLDGMPFPLADSLQSFQYPNLSNLPFPPLLAVDYQYPAIGPSQPSYFQEPNPCQSPGLDEVVPHNKSVTVKSDVGKRPLGDARGNAEIVNVLKRPKIAPNIYVGKEKAGKKELSQFKAGENPTSRIASSSVGKDESEAALDLSLHL